MGVVSVRLGKEIEGMIGRVMMRRRYLRKTEVVTEALEKGLRQMMEEPEIDEIVTKAVERLVKSGAKLVTTEPVDAVALVRESRE